MLSANIFEQVHHVFQVVKVSEQPFGGTQVILCGDFYQLRPVPSPYLGDSGQFCFASEIFKSTFTHRLNLTTVYRQDKPELAKAIGELATGNISPTTDDLMKYLAREVTSVLKPVKLYATNYDVDVYNAEMLMQLPGKNEL